MFGFSIYKQDYSKDYINKMIEAGINDAFISLHVLEELENKEELQNYLKDLNEFNLNIIADISPITLTRFSLEEIRNYNITTLRIDFGFTLDEVISFMQDFNIVLNASTLTIDDIKYLQKKEVDLTKITLMHNFYPKEETGLSYEMYKDLNNNFRKYGFKILTFIPGNLKLRGPIYRGLPTLEEQRNKPFLLNCVQFLNDADQIFIADIEIDEPSLKYLKYLKEGIIPIPIHTNEYFDSKFLNVPLRVRIDSNHLNIRIEDSRMELKTKEQIEANNCIKRNIGTITQDNKLSKRYNGEIMITRTNLEAKENLNVVGTITDKYQELTKYDLRRFKIIFIKEN